MDDTAKSRWKDRKEHADKLIEYLKKQPPETLEINLRGAYASGMMDAVYIIEWLDGNSGAAKHFIKNIIECKRLIEGAA